MMPEGLLVTVPLPATVTSRAYEICVKVAVTLLLASTVTVQMPVPLHAPLQPVNAEPPAAVAVSVTIVPWE